MYVVLLSVVRSIDERIIKRMFYVLVTETEAFFRSFFTGLKCSKEMKDQGNDLFKKGLYKEAVDAFTDAIRLCPEAEKGHLAICYQNRAASHDRLVRFYV